MTPEAISRLQHELSLIDSMGFSEYFLVVKEIVDLRAVRAASAAPGAAAQATRSSATRSASPTPTPSATTCSSSASSTRLADRCPISTSTSTRRDATRSSTSSTSGSASEHVAMVATVNTMTARSAVRVVARSFGLPIDEVNRLSRHLPWVAARKIREVLATYPECAHHPLRDERTWGMLLDLAEQLDYLPDAPRHAPRRLHHHARAGRELDAAAVGGQGHGRLAVRQGRHRGARPGEDGHPGPADALGDQRRGRACASAGGRRGGAGTVRHCPQDDPHVFEQIARADTVGMFQLESSGQRNLSTRLKSSTFEDIIAQISLFRPGPLEAEMITPFIRRRHGLEPVIVPHEGMREVLADSYGVIVYQEQVLLVARAVAGFDLAEADSLRRAMTKGRSREEMERIRSHFLERAIARGVEPQVAEEVFRQLEGFAAYGFNKAHAACFAVVSYASAWLRTYYPAEFAASIMNNEPMGFYTGRLVINDARRHGIAILGPHVNVSAARYTVECDGRAIRVGLCDVHRMTQRLLSEVERERAVRPFRDLADFLRRTRAESPAAASLIRVGALDGLGITEEGRPPTRDELLALLPELKAVIAREGVAGDDTLCLAPAPTRPPEDASHPSGWSPARRISAELELMGLSLTAHPLTLAENDLKARGITFASELAVLPDRAKVRVVGVRERAQTPRTRSGKRTCFLTLEDATGLLDVVVFEDALNRAGETIVKHRAYLVEGILQNNCERGLAIVAETVKPYVVRTAAGDRVRLRRGVPNGPMGPALGGAGAPEEESWEAAGEAYAAEEQAAWDGRGTLRDAEP